MIRNPDAIVDETEAFTASDVANPHDRESRASRQRHAMVTPAGSEIEEWRIVDITARSLAARQFALDADILRVLRDIERLQLWRKVGMVSAIDYVERTFHIGPRTAQEKLRVAHALADVPLLETALRDGVLGYGAVRELTRVAVSSTQRDWLAAAAGRNLREIEELVAGRRPGDRPDDRKDPDLELRELRLRVTPAAYVQWRQSRHDADLAHGTRLSDSEYVEAMCTPLRADGRDGEASGRAKFQVQLTVCSNCRNAWQDGAGARVAVDAATLERAECDAQYIGSTDDEFPSRATQTIPPATVRMVLRRDGNRCQTPGCRSTRGLELHHIQHREHGGDHSPWNLTVRCFACHAAHHAGLITIGGIAPNALTFSRAHDVVRPTASAVTRVPGGAPAPETGTAAAPGTSTASATSRAFGPRAPGGAIAMDHSVIQQARLALSTAGWPSGVAHEAVDSARVKVGTADLGALIREALRCCPRQTTI